MAWIQWAKGGKEAAETTVEAGARGTLVECDTSRVAVLLLLLFSLLLLLVVVVEVAVLTLTQQKCTSRDRGMKRRGQLARV